MRTQRALFYTGDDIEYTRTHPVGALQGDSMDEKGYVILRQLISDVEGAPFPSTINHELYTIWYEHVQEAAGEALEFLNTYDPDYGKNTLEELDF
jgi:hypothetical protein